MEKETRNREARVRRKADREGYRLAKQGETYNLFDHAQNLPVNAGFQDIDEVEDWLND